MLTIDPVSISGALVRRTSSGDKRQVEKQCKPVYYAWT